MKDDLHSNKKVIKITNTCKAHYKIPWERQLQWSGKTLEEAVGGEPITEHVSCPLSALRIANININCCRAKLLTANQTHKYPLTVNGDGVRVHGRASESSGKAKSDATASVSPHSFRCICNFQYLIAFQGLIYCVSGY